jgi:alpha-N-arabinofuranosidase
MRTSSPAGRKAGPLRTLLAACAFLGAAPAHAGAGEGIAALLTVHADKPLAVIAPEIYGQFAEHLGEGMYGGLWVGLNSRIPNTRGFRNDVVGALKALGVPVVRWPGGCFADQYHWRDGIGPRTKRPVRINTTWGGVEERNEVGTHEYMDLIGQLGAKAYINGNLGTGSPQEMKDWLEYLTSQTGSALAQERRKNGRDKPWTVDFFAFGNELWQCGGNMRPDFYMDLYHWYANFAKTPTPGLPKKIVAGAYDDNVAWTEAVMKANTFHDVDALTLHHFSLPTGSWTGAKGPATGFGEDHWMSIMRRALLMNKYITAHSAVMDKYDPEKKVALYVDEWSNWYDVEPGTNRGFLRQQNTLRDALTAALNLDIFHAHADRVRMTNITQMVNVLQAMILTDGARMILTPTYHTFMMYKPFRGATNLAIELMTPDYRFGKDVVPAISASAARDVDGGLVIALVNIDPHRAAHIAISLPGSNATNVTGTILTADAMDAHNSFDAPETVKPVSFGDASVSGDTLAVDMPAKSLVVLRLR